MRWPRRAYRPWMTWATSFLLVWLALVSLNGWWARTIAEWPIALAMLIGSYVAGSTPMGGGTVGFPILVLLFDEPAAFGRQFSFAIQSVGMLRATIFIVCSGRHVAWKVLASQATLLAFVLSVGVMNGLFHAMHRAGARWHAG